MITNCKGYLEETKRLFGVLEIRLNNRDWLVGLGKGKYSIADTKAFPWYYVLKLKLLLLNLTRLNHRVRIHKYAGVENLDEWPAVKVLLINIILETRATSFMDFRLGLSATRLDLLLSLVSKSGSSKSDNNKLLVHPVERLPEKLYLV